MRPRMRSNLELSATNLARNSGDGRCCCTAASKRASTASSVLQSPSRAVPLPFVFLLPSSTSMPCGLRVGACAPATRKAGKENLSEWHAASPGALHLAKNGVEATSAWG